MLFKKAIYWHDWVDKENLELDIETQIKSPCKKYNIVLEKLKSFDLPQCLYEEYFDILFFDWGGMSLGNSCLQSFCGYIIKHAEDNPNKVYVMVSNITTFAMQDMIDNLKACDKTIPFNVYLSIEDLVKRFV